MVKQGKFSVEIVHADTKTAFPEHTAPDGELYVEVEPNAEYYIRVATDSQEYVKIKCKVDGQDLGYSKTIRKSKRPSCMGIWSFKDGKSYNTALLFTKAPVLPSSGEGGAAPAFWTGKVEVTFYEAICKGYKECKDSSSTWTGGDVSYVMGISDPDKKKGVKSDVGQKFEVKKSKRRRLRYSSGGQLASFTLRYCSTLGLIHAGVLPKPPTWELHRQIYPRDPTEVKEEAPTTTVTTTESGAQVTVLDLTDA